jgi:multicomponent Na+:H+ antiporter subunit B
VNRRARASLFVVSAIGLLAVFIAAVRDIPGFGGYRGPYGDVINQQTVYERHVTDVVTAVNFDWRGIDTLGEESILFLAVVGTTVLLRKQPSEEQQTDADDTKDDESEKREVPLPSEATRVATLGLVGPLVAFGLYLVTHGHLTPGGGFQGGVVLATAPLLVYLAGDLKTFKRIAHHDLVEIAEALGIGGFFSLGLLGMALGGAYLRNVLPLGTTGNLFSGGTIPLINLCTGGAVAAGLVMVMYRFLEQTVEIRLRGKR